MAAALRSSIGTTLDREQELSYIMRYFSDPCDVCVVREDDGRSQDESKLILYLQR